MPGTVITRAVILQKDSTGNWKEILLCDEHLKNPKGYLGNIPLAPVNGWRLQYEQDARQRLAALLYARDRSQGRPGLAHRGPLECESEALSIARSQVSKFSRRAALAGNSGVANPAVSAIAQPAAVPAARPAKQASGWDHLKSLVPYVWRYRGMVGLGLLTLALMGLVGALPQLILGIITDCLEGSPQALSTLHGSARALLSPLLAIYAPLSRHALGLFCVILVGVMLVKGFFSFWTRWILIGVSREIEYDLRNDMLARLVELEPEFYVRNRTGDLMSRATNDLNAVRMVLGPGIMYSATTIATMVLAIFFMVKLSPSLTGWVLLPVPVVALAVRYFGETIHRLSEQIQAALGILSTRAQENLTGIRVVRAYAQEKPEIAAFDRANRDYVDRNIKLIATWSLFFPFLTALIGITFVILLGKGGRDFVDHRFTVGTMCGFLRVPRSNWYSP